MADLSYALSMRWRTKTVAVRTGAKEFAHVAVQLDLIDVRHGRARRTKVIDKFMEPTVAQAVLDTLRVGAAAAHIPMEYRGDYFAVSSQP